MTSALTGLRVLDAAGPIGWYASRLFADLGADVLRVEPPGGDSLRGTPPLANGDQRSSIPYWWYNAGKRSVTVDLESDEGKRAFRGLAGSADVVVETFEPATLASWGLGYDTLAARNPGLILTSITPFGQTGPRANWRATDLIGIATSGLLHLSGVPASPPSHPGGNLGYFQAALAGAAGTLIALIERDRSGRGQAIDVSMQDALVFANENALGLWDLMGQVRARIGPRAFTGGQIFYRALDGWQAVWVGGRWDAFLRLAGNAGLDISRWQAPEWFDPVYRTSHVDEIVAAVTELTARHDRKTITDFAQAQRVAAAPVATVADLDRDIQLQSRDFWIDVEQPSPAGEVMQARFPGAPFKMSRTPWRIAGPVEPPGASEGWLADRDAMPAAEHLGKPLAGIRVLDFTWQIAGPGATTAMADHGADVLKVESSMHPDGLRVMAVPRPPFTDSPNQSGIFSVINTSKRSVTINLAEEGGRAILRRLIGLVDVIVDNYGVDPFPKWGLTEAEIRRINPDVIIARSSVMGRSGPLTSFVGFGFTIGPAAGINALTGFPGDPPVGTCTAHPDYSCNPYHFLIAILAAIHHRNRTGEGQNIDLSQHESTVVFNGAAIPAFSVSGEVPPQSANRDATMAPHGVYPSLGADRWVAIACESDDDWPILARAVDRPDLADDPDLATLAGRQARHDEIDTALADWTRRFSPEEAMAELQAVGIPAGAVQHSRDLFRDPHLAARHKLVRTSHPELGTTTLNGPSFSLAATPGAIQRHPPLLGQDTEEIVRDLAGLDDEEMVNAYIEGILQ